MEMRSVWWASPVAPGFLEVHITAMHAVVHCGVSHEVFIRMLMCVPSVSESVSRAIAEHFGSMPCLLEALRDTSPFPEIRLSARTKIGKARIRKLAAALDVARR